MVWGFVCIVRPPSFRGIVLLRPLETWVLLFLNQFQRLLCRKSDDHPQEDLAKSDYKPEIKYKIFNHPSIFLATQ
jgi:hypothetical protein